MYARNPNPYSKPVSAPWVNQARPLLRLGRLPSPSSPSHVCYSPKSSLPLFISANTTFLPNHRGLVRAFLSIRMFFNDPVDRSSRTTRTFQHFEGGFNPLICFQCCCACIYFTVNSSAVTSRSVTYEFYDKFVETLNLLVS